MIKRKDIPKGYRQVRLGEIMPDGALVIDYRNIGEKLRPINSFYINHRVRKDWITDDYKIIKKK